MALFLYPFSPNHPPKDRPNFITFRGNFFESGVSITLSIPQKPAQARGDSSSKNIPNSPPKRGDSSSKTHSKAPLSLPNIPQFPGIVAKNGMIKKEIVLFKSKSSTSLLKIPSRNHLLKGENLRAVLENEWVCRVRRMPLKERM